MAVCMRPFRLGFVRLGSFALLLAFAFSFMAIAPVHAPKVKRKAAFPRCTGSGSIAMWHISSPRKSAITFIKLTSDEARDKFIDRFWALRNPDPGSPSNSYKDDIYQRISYADAHFSTGSGGEGWRTARGQTYITLGPPAHKRDALRCRQPETSRNLVLFEYIATTATLLLHHVLSERQYWRFSIL